MEAAARHITTFCNPDLGEPEHQTAAHALQDAVRNAEVDFSEVVRAMGPELTHANDVHRMRGVELLSTLTESARGLPGAFVGTLLEFYTSRCQDFVCLPQVVLAITTIVDGHEASAEDVRRIVHSLFGTPPLPFESLVTGTKRRLLELVQLLLKKYSEALQEVSQVFVSGFIRLMDGERDPRNLLICWEIHSTISHVFAKDEAVAFLAADLFDVALCYLPVNFTPRPNDPTNITLAELKTALVECLSAPMFAAHCPGFLFEKLGSPIPDTKVDVLTVLQRCAERYDGITWVPHTYDVFTGLKSEVVRGASDPEMQPVLGLVLNIITLIVRSLSACRPEGERVAFLAGHLQPLITATVSFASALSPATTDPKPFATLLHYAAIGSPAACAAIWSSTVPQLVAVYQHVQSQAQTSPSDPATFASMVQTGFSQKRDAGAQTESVIVVFVGLLRALRKIVEGNPADIGVLQAGGVSVDGVVTILCDALTGPPWPPSVVVAALEGVTQSHGLHRVSSLVSEEQIIGLLVALRRVAIHAEAPEGVVAAAMRTITTVTSRGPIIVRNNVVRPLLDDLDKAWRSSDVEAARRMLRLLRTFAASVVPVTIVDTNAMDVEGEPQKRTRALNPNGSVVLKLLNFAARALKEQCEAPQTAERASASKEFIGLVCEAVAAATSPTLMNEDPEGTAGRVALAAVQTMSSLWVAHSELLALASAERQTIAPHVFMLCGACRCVVQTFSTEDQQALVNFFSGVADAKALSGASGSLVQGALESVPKNVVGAHRLQEMSVGKLLVWYVLISASRRDITFPNVTELLGDLSHHILEAQEWVYEANATPPAELSNLAAPEASSPAAVCGECLAILVNKLPQGDLYTTALTHAQQVRGRALDQSAPTRSRLSCVYSTVLVLKALFMRRENASVVNAFVDAVVALVTDRSDEAVPALVARLMRQLVDGENDVLLSPASHCTAVVLWDQRCFACLFPQLLRVSVPSEQKDPAVAALHRLNQEGGCIVAFTAIANLIQGARGSILEQFQTQLMPILIKLLRKHAQDFCPPPALPQMWTSPATTASTPSTADAIAAKPHVESSLVTLATLLNTNTELQRQYCNDLLEPLLALATFRPSLPVRLGALDLINRLADLNLSTVNRQQVLTGLEPALDDIKRRVRKSAGDTRNKWYRLS